jgi:hypothetical protein
MPSCPRQLPRRLPQLLLPQQQLVLLVLSLQVQLSPLLVLVV